MTVVLDVSLKWLTRPLKKVKLQGLGILAVKNRKARIGRNPATGAEIKIPAKRVVKFRVAKDLKDKVL